MYEFNFFHGFSRSVQTNAGIIPRITLPFFPLIIRSQPTLYEGS
jgi:hypothetical protein